MMDCRRLPSLAWLILLAACDHGGPFAVAGQSNLGPFSAVIPRRLTFDPGANRTPSVAGDMILFSRQSSAEPGSYNGNGREECLAFMPVEGGSLSRTLCPDRLVPQPDTLVDTWFEPSLSPDGKRLAFMWQRAYRVSALAYLDAYLMVTDLDHPADTTGIRHEVIWVRPGVPNPTRAGVATRITWLGADTLRFLATREHIQKVKGGGAERVTDTTWDALALVDLDLRTNVLSLVPGGDSTSAYAPAPGGGLWIVKDADSSALLHLDPATGVLLPVGRFSSAVLDLINVDGAPVAITSAGATIERLDVATGVVSAVGGFSGPARRLAAAGNGRFIAEIEQATVLFGAPPALWLFAVP
jgi:hypothetical protein